jgi:hypothetical protein
MNNNLFTALVGKEVSYIIQEEANHRTNEASRAGLFVGLSGWNNHRDNTLHELQIDYLVTHVMEAA